MDRRDLLKGLALLGITNVVGEVEAAENHKKHKNSKGPLGKAHLHFCGIHMAKENPEFQIVTQHHCVSHGKDLHQCLLYESMEPDAKLLGVEYIVSDEVFQKLPEVEKKYWHPHTYEVLAGGLIAPQMSASEEMNFMKALITTWGKTWHTWPDPKTPVPMGEPLLMWALMADDQVDQKVVEARDKEFKVKSSEIRAKRRKEIGYEVPNVKLPKNRDTVGRQWTSSGDDKPTKI